jgi:sugar phosphate isomerase/epimerase
MGRIKLGICLKSLGQPFRRSLPLAHPLGVAGVELEAAGELLPQKLTATGRREITHLLRSYDLEACALVCPLRRGLDDPENLEPRLEQIRLTMALAFDLGPRLVIIQAGQIPNLPPAPVVGQESGIVLGASLGSMLQTGASAHAAPSPPAPLPQGERGGNLMKESLEALGKHGDRTGVTVALDTGHDAPETLVAFLDRLDVGSLAVNYNPANLVISGHDPHAAIKTLNRRIVHVHAQDARRISPNKMATVPLGHGDLDWIALLANFEEVDYRGYLTALADDRAELTAAVAFLRRFVA